MLKSSYATYHEENTYQLLNMIAIRGVHRNLPGYEGREGEGWKVGPLNYYSSGAQNKMMNTKI